MVSESLCNFHVNLQFMHGLLNALVQVRASIGALHDMRPPMTWTRILSGAVRGITKGLWAMCGVRRFSRTPPVAEEEIPRPAEPSMPGAYYDPQARRWDRHIDFDVVVVR